MIFALSSACSDAAVTPTACLALAKQQARLAKWHHIDLAHVVYTPGLGALDDPGACDVQIVGDLPDAEAAVNGAIAYHTTVNGRPVCYISWNTVKINGGTLYGPSGLWVAVSHEMCEARINPTVNRYVTNPAGQREAYEVCDRLQGTDYVEDGSPGIYLANALGPHGFELGYAGTPVDIASDLRHSTLTNAFPLSAGGYYAPVGSDPVFGELAPEHLRRRVAAKGGRHPRARDAELDAQLR